MAQNQQGGQASGQQHGDQSIGSGHTQDGIRGTPSGTEGATSGQGIDKGQSRQSTQDPGNRQGSDGTETYQRNDLFEDDGEDGRIGESDPSRSQQSTPREGMGDHRHSGERNNRQGSDFDRSGDDSDDSGNLGNQQSDKDPTRQR